MGKQLKRREKQTTEMGNIGQLDKPTRVRLLNHFNVEEHSGGKYTATCQVCNDTTLKRVSIGRVLAHLVPEVSGAKTCANISDVNASDLSVSRKASGLRDSEPPCVSCS